MSTVQVDKDTAELHQLGYAQELRRRMGGFSNFAVSFTIISVLSGGLTLYFFGMTYGGPVDIVWGWILVGIMTTIVGLGMAEIASAYPTAGGLYYWSAKLAKSNSAGLELVHRLVQPAGPGGRHGRHRLRLRLLLRLVPQPDGQLPDTTGYILLVYAGILIVHGLLNTFGVRVVALLSDISVWWHLLGVGIIAVVLVFVPSHHASASFVFTKFINLSTLASTRYLCVLHRVADGPVHLHRLRRLGPHVGGDHQPRHGRA